jgi:cytochrome P450
MAEEVRRPNGPDGGIYGVSNLLAFQRDTLGFLSSAATTYGDISYFKMAAFHFYLLNHPDYVHEVLVKHGNKIVKWKRQTDTWANAVGHSTLTLEGAEWNRHRRLLNPAFHAATVVRYHDIIISQTQRLLDRWQSGQSYEMMFEMMRTTMSIIAEIIFSVKDLERDASDLNQALTGIFEVLTARTVAFQQLPSWLPTRDNRRVKKATATIEAFIMSLIRERRAENVDYGDILSDLLTAKDEETGATLSDREICNELKTLFGAGHETTALMLMWTMHLLSQNMAVQEKLCAETVDVLGNKPPKIEDIERLPYTDQVLNESMRIFPPAWSLMVRQVQEPIEVGEWIMPKGSVLLIPMWTIHRSPTIFPDPLEFRPERFADNGKRRYPRYAHFPFGGGPHVCLGAHLATFEGQIMLPMMVQRYRFDPVPQPELKLQALLTLRPKDGLLVKVVSR